MLAVFYGLLPLMDLWLLQLAVLVIMVLNAVASWVSYVFYRLHPDAESTAGPREHPVRDPRSGRRAFDTSSVTDVQATPQLREGRREQRNGMLVLVVSAAALVFGLAADIVNLIPIHPGWHPLTNVAFIAGGVFTVQGIREIRNGRATVRDELRRQTEAAAGPHVDREDHE